MKVIETERLILRTWENKDAEVFYRINQDPKVIEFVKGSLTMQEVNDFIALMNKQFDELGYTVWAAEEKSSGKLMGYIGLDSIRWNPPFGKSVEIEWRLGSEYWNRGYATEGAKACLVYGFNECALKEIVSFTVPDNVRSLHVMEKIGMIRDVDGDFDHPDLPIGHKLARHVLYRIKNSDLKLIPLSKADFNEIVAAFNAIGWNKPQSIYEAYLKDQETGNRIVFVAKVANQFAGYVTLKWHPEYTSFQKQDIPEISDLNVLPQCREKGIGTALIHACEQSALEKGCDKIGLGVGLTADYGNAQRLYIRLGYMPDGKGIHYQNKMLGYGETATVDDDLVLYLTKKLR